MPQTVHVQCPVCQNENQCQIETVINSQENPHLKISLLSGQLLAFECETCGAKRQIETQILYHDPEKSILIFLAPNYHENKEKVLTGLSQMTQEQGIAIQNYKLRIVTSSPQLIEKIQIFDQGYDDQTMEVVKLLTDGLFAQQEPEKPILNRFFMIKDGVEKFLYISDKEQLIVDYHPTLTEFIQDKFSKELAPQYLGQFILVDQTWATNIANHLPGPGIEIESDE